MCHTVALPFTLKSILRHKKNYGNSNILYHEKILSSKSPLKETKIFQDIITLFTNLKFQHKPKYLLSKNPPVEIDLLLPRGQSPLSYYTL